MEWLIPSKDNEKAFFDDFVRLSRQFDSLPEASTVRRQFDQALMEAFSLIKISENASLKNESGPFYSTAVSAPAKVASGPSSQKQQLTAAMNIEAAAAAAAVTPCAMVARETEPVDPSMAIGSLFRLQATIVGNDSIKTNFTTGNWCTL